MTLGAGDALALAIPRAAASLERIDTPINERALEKELVLALEAEGIDPITRQAVAKLRDWPNVGPYDIRLGTEAVIEIKWWGQSASKRFETLWDACKVANAIDEALLEEAYLVAGAHEAVWAKQDGYTGLFDSGHHDTIALCIPSANFFKSPMNDNTTVTKGIQTIAIASAPFELYGESYALRCARVAPLGERAKVPQYVSPRSRTRQVHTPGALPMPLREDRFAGSLLGGALGDALGAPVEFLSLNEIRRRFGEQGIMELAPVYGRVGAITDDTQMTLFTAEGLLRAHNRWLGKGISHIPSVVRHAYARWLYTQGRQDAGRPFAQGTVQEWPDGWLISLTKLHNQRAPGNTCLAGAASARMGTIEAPLNDSKGCGAVMRSAPVGLAPVEDPFLIGNEIGALTHGHPSGYLAAGALALLVRMLVCGTALEESLDEAIRRLRDEPRGDECADALERGRELGRGVPTPDRIEQLGGGWVAEEALAIGVCCALAAGDDFVGGIRLAANHGGDSDSTAAIAGNLLGARVGRTGLPEEWLQQLELREAIEQLALDLAQHHEQPESSGPFDASLGDEERYPGW